MSERRSHAHTPCSLRRRPRRARGCRGVRGPRERDRGRGGARRRDGPRRPRAAARPRTGSRTRLRASGSGSTPARCAPALAARLAVTLERDGKPFTRLDTGHDEPPLHLILVRRDLAGYVHVHPVARGDSFTTGVTLPTPGCLACVRRLRGGRREDRARPRPLRARRVHATAPRRAAADGNRGRLRRPAAARHRPDVRDQPWRPPVSAASALPGRSRPSRRDPRGRSRLPARAPAARARSPARSRSKPSCPSPAATPSSSSSGTAATVHTVPFTLVAT